MKPKKPRKPRTTGMDMCTCYAFHCDPMSMSRKFQDKINKRLRAGLCGACGHNPCECKSSMSVKKWTKPLSRRQMQIQANASRAKWLEIFNRQKQQSKGTQ